MLDELKKAMEQKPIHQMPVPTPEQLGIPEDPEHGKVIKLCSMCMAPEYERIIFHTGLCMAVNHLLHVMSSIQRKQEEANGKGSI